MKFSVDGWDPSYGQAYDADDPADENGESSVLLDVEVPEDQWAPIPARDVDRPASILFVDGVRRIDARLWVSALAATDPPIASICASYGSGVVCCCDGQAHVVKLEVRRGLFTFAAHATDVATNAGRYDVCHTADGAGLPAQLLSLALQRRMADLEVQVALSARAQLHEHGIAVGDDLLIVDGPLPAKDPLDRALGYIKTHHRLYLPAHLNTIVGQLTAGERTPVFELSKWRRYTWYLKLPTESTAPWAGVVRVEFSAEHTADDAAAFANLSQAVLPTFAASEHKDPRAPQNLYPIGGLEKALRHRLGDQQLLYRALKAASFQAQP